MNYYHDERGRFASCNGCNGFEAKKMRDMATRYFEGKAQYNKGGSWEIGRGGYDLQYEVSHNGTPVFGCVDNEIEVYQKEYLPYAREFAKISGDKVIGDEIKGGSIVRLKSEDGKGYDKGLYVVVDDDGALKDSTERGEYNDNTSVYVVKIGDKTPFPGQFHTSIGWLDKVSDVAPNGYTFNRKSALDMGNVYPHCFTPRNDEEERCAGMCESIIAYDEGIDDPYLDKYRKSLGKKRVSEIFGTIKNFVDNKCVIRKNTYTDNEGVSYNGIELK